MRRGIFYRRQRLKWQRIRNLPTKSTNRELHLYGNNVLFVMKILTLLLLTGVFLMLVIKGGNKKQ